MVTNRDYLRILLVLPKRTIRCSAKSKHYGASTSSAFAGTKMSQTSGALSVVVTIFSSSSEADAIWSSHRKSHALFQASIQCLQLSQRQQSRSRCRLFFTIQKAERLIRTNILNSSPEPGQLGSFSTGSWPTFQILSFLASRK